MQLLAFFLNVYQSMYIHYFLKTVHENTKQSKQQLTLWARFVKCWFD